MSQLPSFLPDIFQKLSRMKEISHVKKMDTSSILITLESIKKACGALLEPDVERRQEVCDKITVGQRRTLFSKDTRLFLESVFEKKKSPNSRERKAIADKCGLTPVQVRVWFTNRRWR
uniref:Mating type a1 protein n=1 Tax=Kluyveromyces waltii TaxID=4914 RepID=A6H5E2_KLUWA|nr:mating type a1 protein [Lachancea waltii]